MFENASDTSKRRFEFNSRWQILILATCCSCRRRRRCLRSFGLLLTWRVGRGSLGRSGAHGASSLFQSIGRSTKLNQHVCYRSAKKRPGLYVRWPRDENRAKQHGCECHGSGSRRCADAVEIPRKERYFLGLKVIMTSWRGNGGSSGPFVSVPSSIDPSILTMSSVGGRRRLRSLAYSRSAYRSYTNRSLL